MGNQEVELKSVLVKTGEIRIRPVSELILLYQHWFPGFDDIQWLYKSYHWGMLGEVPKKSFSTIFAISYVLNCSEIKSIIAV